MSTMDNGPVYVLTSNVKQEIKRRYKTWVERGNAVKQYLVLPGVVYVELWLNKSEKIDGEEGNADVWTSCFRLSGASILGNFQNALLGLLDNEFGDTYVSSSGSIQNAVPTVPDNATITVSSTRPTTAGTTPGRGSVFFDGFGSSLTFDEMQDPDLLLDSFGGDSFGDSFGGDGFGDSTNQPNVIETNGVQHKDTDPVNNSDKVDTNTTDKADKIDKVESKQSPTKPVATDSTQQNSPQDASKVSPKLEAVQTSAKGESGLSPMSLTPPPTRANKVQQHLRHSSESALSSPPKNRPPVAPRPRLGDSSSPSTSKQLTQPNLFSPPTAHSFSVNDFHTTVPPPPSNANAKKLQPPIYMDIDDVPPPSTPDTLAPTIPIGAGTDSPSDASSSTGPPPLMLSPPPPGRPQLPVTTKPTEPSVVAAPTPVAAPLQSLLPPSAKPPMSPDLQFTPGLGRKPPPTPRGLSSTLVTAIFDKTNQALQEVPEASLLECIGATKVLLGRNKLTAVPSSLSQFTQLQVLDLSYNRFEKLPPVTRFLGNLRELQLQGNAVLVNSDGIKGISDLSSLRKLDLSSNQISPDIETVLHEDLFGLTRLETLILSRNSLRSIPASIEVLQCVTALEFIENQITEIPVQLGNLPALRRLNLSKNYITEIPAELVSASALVELNLSDNQISYIPINFAHFYNLSILNLNNNLIEAIPAEILGGGTTELCYNEDGSQFIPGVYALTELKMRNNRLTSFPFEVYYLEKLKKLDLSCNQIEVLPYSEEASIAALANLLELNLACNRLYEVPEDLSKLYSLETLNLSSNELTYVPWDLWQLSSLRQLSVGYNKLSALPLPPPEATWDSLDELFAAGNKELCEFQPFGKMSSLRDFYLQGCGFITVPFAPYVESVPELEKVDLSFNLLDENQLAPELFRLDYLQRLALSHNKFTRLPEELGEARRLEYLDIGHNELAEEPEPIKKLLREVGTEVICTGNPYSLGKEGVGSSQIFDVVMTEIVGRRPTMEDAFGVCGCVGGDKDTEAFAVFDGHAGSTAAKYASQQLEPALNSIIAANPTSSPLEWLRLAITKINEDFREFLATTTIRGARHCGATGLVVLYRDNKLYIANVGDTRAVLARGGQSIRISTDDKPGSYEEESRIRALGGFVVVGQETSRINGTLAVSRCIGDFYMQPFVSSEPHLYEIELTAEDTHIILACDGVWDEISDQMAVDTLGANSDDLTRAGFSVRDRAYVCGSDDNISVLLLQKKIV